MKLISGSVKLIGNRRNTHRDGETLSVLEVGNQVIRNVVISDYLDNYLNVGEDVELLVYKNLTGKRLITAIKTLNGTYKMSPIGLLIGFIFKTLLFAIPFIGLPLLATNGSYTIFTPLVLIGACLTLLFFLLKMKHLVQLIKF